MAYKVKVVLNSQGVRDVLNAPGIAGFDRKLAEGVKRRAIGMALMQNASRIKDNPDMALAIADGYEIEEIKTGQRTKYKVVATNWATRMDNNKYNTLLKALYG